MPEKSKTKLREEAKVPITANLLDYLKATYSEDAAKVKDNEIMFPFLDSERNEIFVVVKVTVPIGENHGAIAYDGYEAAAAYERETAAKAEKKAAAETKKAAKIAKDKAAREAKAKAKAAAAEKGE